MLTAEELYDALHAGEPYYWIRDSSGKLVKEYGKVTGKIVGQFEGKRGTIRAGKAVGGQRKYIPTNVIAY